jgi:hypothetical protein
MALELRVTEKRALDLERSFVGYNAGAKEQAIMDATGMTATLYYQMLNRLIDTREALAYDPVTVNRLRRLRVRREQERAS